MGFNYVLVFSPNAIEDAPHNLAATIELPRGRSTNGLLRNLVRDFPSSSVNRGRPAADPGARDPRAGLAGDPRRGFGGGARPGFAVLLGAIAAARAARTYDTGDPARARREHPPAAGAAARRVRPAARRCSRWSRSRSADGAWLVIVQLFEFEWLPDWPRVFAVLGAGIALVLAFALGASLPLLRAPAARTLRRSCSALLEDLATVRGDKRRMARCTSGPRSCHAALLAVVQPTMKKPTPNTIPE
jgi:putative ABC transport system permease protein